VICPNCKFEQNSTDKECPRCGIIFEKYQKHQGPELKSKSLPAEEPEEIMEDENPIKNLLFYVKPDINPLYFGGRILILLVTLIWGIKFILSSVESGASMASFLHLVNLPFHEAGHIFFRPFGRFMTSLGGSLTQLLMPMVCLAVFLVATRDTFAASVSLWWIGENFMDLAPYINDARSLTLPLLGGNTGRTAPYGFHDWEFILNELGWLRYDHTLAQTASTIGTVLIITALVWAGYILFEQYKNLDL